MERRRLEPVLADNALDIQCGGIGGRAIDFAIHLVQLFFAFAKEPVVGAMGGVQRFAHSAACIYSDLEAAFYSMMQQFLTEMPESDVVIASLCARLQLPEDTMHRMHSFGKQGSILANASVSEHDRRLIQESFRCRWSALGCTDMLAVPNSGCQPGMPLADFLFNFAFSASP